MSLCRQTTQTAANVTWRRARARSNRKEGPTLITDRAFLSKFILQNKLIIITKNSYEARHCQLLQDQFHEHFPDQLYKIVLATLQKVSVTCMRVGMQVLRGSLKVQNHSVSVCQIIRMAGTKKKKKKSWGGRLLAFWYLTCQDISKGCEHWDILLVLKQTSANFLTLKNPE